VSDCHFRLEEFKIVNRNARMKVNSSNIENVEYDEKSETMSVTFNNNSTYQLHNVPKSVYERLINAGSVGSYYASNIKGRYSTSKVA
jgi:hypothetical protein